MRGLKEIKGVSNWRDARAYRSDYGEDIFTIDFFNQKTEGYLLDIGAADGVTGSNSFRLLDEFNWNGILVEPNPDHHKNLDLLFSNETGIDVYKGAICQNQTEVTLSKWSGLYTGHSNIINKNSHSWNSHPVQVPAIDISTLLKLYNVPTIIDFINLDIEGSEHQVINYFPWEDFTVKLWCIERASAYGLDKVLIERGYVRLKDTHKIVDPINEFYALKN